MSALCDRFLDACKMVEVERAPEDETARQGAPARLRANGIDLRVSRSSMKHNLAISERQPTARLTPAFASEKE